MCLLPEMFCCWCLSESYGQLLRYPVEEVEEGLQLCTAHKREYLQRNQFLNSPIEGREIAPIVASR